MVNLNNHPGAGVLPCVCMRVCMCVCILFPDSRRKSLFRVRAIIRNNVFRVFLD